MPDRNTRRSRAWSAGLLSAGLLLLLAACATPPGGGAQQGAPAAKPAAEPAQSLAALPPDLPLDDDPERLLGLDPSGLEGVLGVPELVRQEAPARIWQYRAGGCVLDVVLYDQVEGGPENGRVTYIEARDRKGAKIETRPCLNEVLRAQLTS